MQRQRKTRMPDFDLLIWYSSLYFFKNQGIICSLFKKRENAICVGEKELWRHQAQLQNNVIMNLILQYQPGEEGSLLEIM